MEIKKGTHEEYQVELFMPIMKEAGGKYIAVLSDDSVDRDEERISKECIEKLGQDNNYLAALCNHKNDVFMQVAEWTNRGAMRVGDNIALVAEPKFYKSNPNAKIIQGMLDEGAKLGISIGAIVKNYDDIGGMRVYSELELVEASFVAIPSNRHGRAMAVAKSFNTKMTDIKEKIMEENKMDEKFTQKDIDSAIEKTTSDFTKKLEAKDAEISKLQKDLADSKIELDKKIAEASEIVEAKKNMESKLKDAEAEIVKVKAEALEKQQFANQGAEDAPVEDIEKEFSAGKIPVMRM